MRLPPSELPAAGRYHAHDGRKAPPRKGQGKSPRGITGLAGMGKSTLHRIEHGQRDLTLSEITALASVLEIPSSKLIVLPIFVQ